MKSPGVTIDILIVRDNKILLGLLTKEWNYEGKQVYGVPGRDIYINEKIGETVKRNIKEEFNCNVSTYKIICVNVNYALGNHYIGIGILAEIDGDPKIPLSDDWEKWEWFDKKNLPNSVFPAAKNLIECYVQNKVNIAE